MRIKDLFFPNPEQKVTDKYLRRTLLVSICGILLCMSCLVGTTWAWFAVSVENTGNVITVATKPKVLVSINNDSVKTLQPGTHEVCVEHASEPDDVQKKSTLYVTFSLNEVVQGYVILNQENGYSATVNITTKQESILSWTASWFKPEGAEQIVDYTIDLTVQDAPEESTEATTTPTETKDPTETTTTPTETKDPTETTTTPTETKDPTETTTKPTETTTDPTETTTKPTEETTQTTENETTQETTQPESQETVKDTAESENSSAEDQV